MTPKIWKFLLKTTDVQTVSVPSGTKFLTAQVQRGALCLWGIVPGDTNVRFDQRKIYVVGTGNPMPSPSAPHLTLNYIATVQMPAAIGAELVRHIFEEK